MSRITEIAPDIYRISLFVPEINLQFNHFLVRDDEPLLYHTGTRRMFPLVREELAKVMDPAKLRWITFSHFEADECGAMNEWLAIAPNAQVACGQLGALLSVNDFCSKPARELASGEVLSTGKYRFRYVPTPHLPHGWDAGVCFEETQQTLLCSDLFHQVGDVEPMTHSDILGRARAALVEYQAHPLLAEYMPYSNLTEKLLNTLANLKPRTLAAMHGSTFVGDGARACRDLAVVMREVLGGDRSDKAVA